MLALSLCTILPAFCQWSTTSLSMGRQWPTTASVGVKALFAGGYYYTNPYNIATYQGVDIYDDSTGQWTTDTLSTGRTRMAATSTNNLAFFGGGGFYVNNGSIPSFSYSTRVDIYNANTNQWAIAELSQARANMVAASVMGKVLFAGGENSSSFNLKTVDIYDVVSNQWSTTQLPRLSGARLGVASVGSKVYFAANNMLDIYDVSTGQWATDMYPQPTLGISGVSLGDRGFFAGGFASGNSTYTNWVNIFNTTTSQWSSATLSAARSDIAGIRVGNVLLFGGGYGDGANVVDIYDGTSNMWSSTQLPHVSGPLGVAKAGNKALFAGNGSNIVDVYTVSPSPVCQSVQSGNWNDSSTWACGHVPGVSDHVVIDSGHIVTLPSGTNRAKMITYKGGSLVYDTESSQLFIGLD